MANETIAIEPLVDPENIGGSLDAIIPIQANLLSGWHYGDTDSRRRGSGFEIDGINDYEPGDDPRLIDWRATARHPEHWPQIRQHYAEITPSLWLVTDIADKRYTANGGHFSEQQLAVSAILTLMRQAEAQGMPVALAATNGTELFMEKEPVRSKQHLLGAGNKLTELTAQQPSEPIRRRWLAGRARHEAPQDGVTLDTVLEQVSKRAVQSVVAIVSDFRYCDEPENTTNGWAQPLWELAKHGNDIIAVELKNPQDDALPEKADNFWLDAGAVALKGREGEAIRARYAELAIEQQEAIDSTLSGVKAAHIVLSTTEPEWRTSLYEQLQANNAA